MKRFDRALHSLFVGFNMGNNRENSNCQSKTSSILDELSPTSEIQITAVRKRPINPPQTMATVTNQLLVNKDARRPEEQEQIRIRTSKLKIFIIVNFL